MIFRLPTAGWRSVIGRERRWPWLVVLSLALAALGQYLLVDQLGAGLITFVVAVLILLMALAVQPSTAPRRQELAVRKRRRWSYTRLGLALVGVGCNVFALIFLWRDDTSLFGLFFWCVSLGLVTLAAPRFPRVTLRVSGRGKIVAVAFVLLLAVLLRIYRLRDLPPGVFIDETNAALDALRILDGERVSPFATGWFETPALYAYYMAGLFRLLGVNFFALRLVSILPGLLTVVAIYPLARRAFGSLSALLSLFLLATARWHIHMSRWGWNELMPPLFQILVAYLLLRGLEREQARDFALAGLALGLSQYTYLAARLIPVMVFIFLLHQVVTVRGFLRRHWVNLLLLVLVSMMTFAALGLTYLKNPFLWINRAQQVSIVDDLETAGNLRPLWDNLVKHLLMFNYQGDANPRHNLPQSPMLDPFTGALLIPAVGYALYRWRDRRYALLVLWIAVTLLGGVLSMAKEAPQGYRTLGVLPAVALLVGDLLVRLWRQLSQPAKKVWRGVAGAGLMVFLALSIYHNVRVYFVTYAQDHRTFWGFTPLETGVARTVSSALGTHDVYVVPKLAHFSSLRLATYQRPEGGSGGLARPPYHTFLPSADLPLPNMSGRDALLVLETQYLSLTPFIGHYYPESETRLHRAPDGQPLYVTVEIPHRALTDVSAEPPVGQGLLGSYFEGAAWQGQPRDRRIDPLLLFHWYGKDPLPDPFSVRWEGEIVLPEDGSYFFALVGDDGVRLSLNGELVGESGHPDAPNVIEAHLDLKAGIYPIRVEYFQRSGSKCIEFRWSRPGTPLQLVPPSAFRPPAGMTSVQNH